MDREAASATEINVTSMEFSVEPELVTREESEPQPTGEDAPPATGGSEEPTRPVAVADFVEATAKRGERRRKKTREDAELSAARKEVEELVLWFKNYGKDGLIIKSPTHVEAEDKTLLSA